MQADRALSLHRMYGSHMVQAIWRHRMLHGFAVAAFALASAVWFKTGNMPDVALVFDYGFYFLSAAWICGCFFALVRLFQLMVIERNPAPLGAFIRSFGPIFANSERLANGINGFVVLTVFAISFSALKGTIPFFHPFSWDIALHDLDKALHFGNAPYELLSWLTRSPLLLWLVNFAYNFWFVVLLATMFAASFAANDTQLRHRFLWSLMLLWLGGGFILATLFSSAGPCFLARLGLGSDYQPLMDALETANQHYPIWALSTQNALWDGYIGARPGSAGISAFPSMHVATAVLIALYATRHSRVAGALLWIFALVIMVSSVVLGWHYAVDGYAGALLAAAIWKAVGFVLKRQASSDMAEV